MWAFLFIVAIAGLAAVHWSWRKRCRELNRVLDRSMREVEALKEHHLETLAHEHAQQQALFNSMTEGVLLLDQQGRVRLINQGLERLFNLSYDIRGQTIMEAFRMHELRDIVNRTTVEGHVLAEELDLPGLDNRCLQVNAATILNREGKHQGILLVFHDLTRLRQLENTRKEFVANVSHELRTPLSLIKGYVETLIDGAKDDPAVAMRFLQTIEKHADRLTYLIEDLLTISRLESGQIVLNMQAVALRPLVDRVVIDFESRTAEKKVAILNQVPTELTVRADADRLQQVLFNLVDNAMKYGKNEGRIEISAKNAGEDKAVEMCVADDGPGIPPEATERVFERFYRVDRARSREQGGTGLGLAIVKHIVQSHGGEVWVTSDPGNGAKFYFTLQRE
ncbi:MAG: ATP-binding protein [Verrucomicrobiota bacterium]